MTKNKINSHVRPSQNQNKIMKLMTEESVSQNGT